ncbi:hypothetical protein P8452_74357 [Trifolium repens]|nr:hypothetical protein P8452_74357 [Trifolium repens]
MQREVYGGDMTDWLVKSGSRFSVKTDWLTHNCNSCTACHAYATELFREEHQTIGLSIETLHNHSGSNASTDDAEALENGSKRVDKEKNVQNNENLFMKKLVDLSGGFARITGIFSIPLLQKCYVCDNYNMTIKRFGYNMTIPVLPQGVLQFGSSKTVAEDL